MKIKDLIFGKGLLPLFFAISIVLCFCLLEMLVNAQNEKRRLKSNVETLTSQVVKFRTSDGKNAAQVKTLTLTTSELKEQNTQLVSELKTISVKPRNVKNIQQISTSAKYEVQLVKKDTMISDTVRAITYKYADNWISIDAVCSQQGDTCTAKIITCDSLLIVQHCKTKKFLFWTWKKYSGQATVKNYNPYSQIRSIRNIDIQK